jgi:6-pyruvoyltetrahydropterin/6-carboxytetrahydropterin synthase
VVSAAFGAARRGAAGEIRGAGMTTTLVANNGLSREQLMQRLQDQLRGWEQGLIDLPDSSDLALASGIAEAARSGGGNAAVSLASCRDRGVDLDAQGRHWFWMRFEIQAAHYLPNVPEGHQCGRMHGHGFGILLHASEDHAAIAAAWQPFAARLDYACLNDIPGLENPTSEVLAAWIWPQLKAALPGLACVSVFETATSGCHFDGVEHRIWKHLRFESAVQLKAVAEGDPRRRLHGHSYLVRLHLTAPLDEVFGWTVDYGDVKRLFRPAYQALDHHRLDELSGLEDCDTSRIAGWIERQLQPLLPSFNRVDLFERAGYGVVLCRDAGDADKLPIGVHRDDLLG